MRLYGPNGELINTRSYDPQIEGYQRISPIGGALVEQTTRLIGAQFEGSLSNGTADNFWATARGTNATSVIANKIATLTSGTTNADWCSIATPFPARFLFANPNMFRALVKFAAVAAADTVTHIGAISLSSGAPQNGYSFEIDGAGAVSLASWNAGSKVLDVSSAFNGELGTTYSIPDTNMHQFEIIYFAARVWFLIDGSLLHTAEPTTVIYSGEMSVPIGVSIVVGAAAASRIVECWDSSTLRFGKELTRPQHVHVHGATTTLLKTGSGTLQSVVLGDGTIGNVDFFDALTAVGSEILMLTPINSTPPSVLPVNIDFFTGLTMVTGGSNHVTVIFD